MDGDLPAEQRQQNADPSVGAQPLEVADLVGEGAGGDENLLADPERHQRTDFHVPLVVLVLGAEAGVVLLGGMLLRRRVRPSPTPGAPLPYGSSS